MSIEGVHHFTSAVLNNLFASQNATGNIAISGISWYVIMGAINFALRGRSNEQLSSFLGESFVELHDTTNWKDSQTAQKWCDLDELIQDFYNVHSAFFYSCDIFDHYVQVSDFIFTLDKIKVNFSNPADSAKQINDWVYYFMHGSSKKIFDEGMIRENMIAYIDSLFVGVDWKNYFDSSLTQHETFYDRQGQPMKVEMMSQTEMHRIYYSPDGNFSILFKRLGEKNQFAAIVLPTKGYSIEEVLKNFKFDEMKIYLNSSKMNMVKVKLPKFKIIGQNDLKSTLNLFGVTDILDLHHSDFGHMTNSTVFIGSLIQLVHVSVGELGVNAEDDDDIDEESIPGEENDGEDTVDQPKSEADDKNEDQDDQQRSDVEDDEERNEVDKSLLETELDGEEKGDQSLPEREQVINDNEEKSHSESEDSEDTFDQSLTEEDFFVVRPFLFLMYSSQEGVVFYSGVVTNPNAH